MGKIICKNCGEQKEHQAKGLCFNCYRKISWKQKLVNCKRCGRPLPMHAKGLCGGCYNFVFKSDNNKAWNYKKWHRLDIETYKKITKTCIVCDFDKMVDLHHLDEDNENNSLNNLVGLCPNHHRMLHDFRYRKEMRETLEKKGFAVPKDSKLDFSLS